MASNVPSPSKMYGKRMNQYKRKPQELGVDGSFREAGLKCFRMNLTARERYFLRVCRALIPH